MQMKIVMLRYMKIYSIKSLSTFIQKNRNMDSDSKIRFTVSMQRLSIYV